MTGLLFDLDGTLLDTLDDLMDGVNAALAQFGYPSRSRDEIRRFVGNGAARLIQLAVPEGALWEPVYAAFQAYYPDHCRIKTAPYTGIPEALRLLSDLPMAIVSNKPDTATKRLCADFFPGVFALGQRDGCPRKPEPDMVYAAMEAIGVIDCIYIGDSEVDVRTAANAKVPCLSVLWGFRDKAELCDAGAVHFCGDPSELPDAVRHLLNDKK